MNDAHATDSEVTIHDALKIPVGFLVFLALLSVTTGLASHFLERTQGEPLDPIGGLPSIFASLLGAWLVVRYTPVVDSAVSACRALQSWSKTIWAPVAGISDGTLKFAANAVIGMMLVVAAFYTGWAVYDPALNMDRSIRAASMSEDHFVLGWNRETTENGIALRVNAYIDWPQSQSYADVAPETDAVVRLLYLFDDDNAPGAGDEIRQDLEGVRAGGRPPSLVSAEQRDWQLESFFKSETGLHKNGIMGVTGYSSIETIFLPLMMFWVTLMFAVMAPTGESRLLRALMLSAGSLSYWGLIVFVGQ